MSALSITANDRKSLNDLFYKLFLIAGYTYRGLDSGALLGDIIAQGLNDLSTLGTHTHGEGASLVGIEDAGGLITAVTVEGALAELATSIASVSGSLAGAVLATDLASTAHNKGASLVGIEDAGGLITATTVEAALAELAGNRVKTADLASTANAKGASLVGIEDAGTLITATTVEGALAELATGRAKLTDLASTSNGKGASLIGIEDAGGLITATTVEAALAELAAKGTYFSWTDIGTNPWSVPAGTAIWVALGLGATINLSGGRAVGTIIFFDNSQGVGDFPITLGGGEGLAGGCSATVAKGYISLWIKINSTTWWTVQYPTYDVVNGGKLNVTGVKTGDYTAVIYDLVRCDPSGAGFAVNLPAISAANKGRQIVVKNVTTSTNEITVTRAGSDTIDAATTYPMTTSKGSVTLVSDGVSNWMVI